MVKIKIGDVFEINTDKGKAYFHYIFFDKRIGSLIRVLPGLFKERPLNIEDLVKLKEKFMVFFPLARALKLNIVNVVGFYPTNDFKVPKYMKVEHYIRGEFLGWYIVDIITWKQYLVDKLSDEQKQLSPWGIWNDTLLIERLESNWDLEKWG